MLKGLCTMMIQFELILEGLRSLVFVYLCCPPPQVYRSLQVYTQMALIQRTHSTLTGMESFFPKLQPCIPSYQFKHFAWEIAGADEEDMVLPIINRQSGSWPQQVSGRMGVYLAFGKAPCSPKCSVGLPWAMPVLAPF